jgi:hypothetical protein
LRRAAVLANHARGESLRRLHLAAQCGETLFFMMRPLASAQDASPAPLRLSLRPRRGRHRHRLRQAPGTAARRAAVPAHLPLALLCSNAMRLWIGLYLPRLPLEVFSPNWSTDPGSVVLEQERVLGASPARAPPACSPACAAAAC